MSSADDLAFIKSWVNTRAEEFNSIKPPKPPRKPRRRTNKTQQSLLESAFQDNRRPNTAAKELLARKLGMDVRTVQIWFQNRRQTLRKKKLEPIIVPQNSENSDEKQCKDSMARRIKCF
ncbi:hypothetical protein K7432_008528 [Basidiobolus ranarum]|uniref:Homeobox domain-containing protein n=1 Tax=Basidiobolus ranarum TaxID=34480 RepID=A0ABR2WRS5_9FUNG